MKKLDLEYFERGARYLIGVDEVGRGCLAGGVTAAAVAIDRSFVDPGIKDSKKLSAKKREILSGYIKKHALAYAVVTVEVDMIDKVNILNAALLAMENAVFQIAEKIAPEQVLVDGNRKLDIPYAQEALTGGDDRSTVIGAASIIAKVERDDMMNRLHDLEPYYGFDKNKGYGTLVHRSAIAEFGITSFHRKGFKGVKEYL